MSAIDPFHGLRHPAAAAYKAEAVTPNDGVDLPFVTIRVRATGAGNIQVNMLGDKPGVVTVLPFAAAETQMIRVRRIYATNTTATGITAYY